MDTRFWGPSGWQLIHLIAFQSRKSQDVLLMLKDILPCKFCRESTSQFTKEISVITDTGKWTYELHKKVNNKLRTQCKDDPTVINPGLDPTYEEIQEKYKYIKPVSIPGRDFLFSIAINYPESPDKNDITIQHNFMHKLSEVYPFESSIFKKYILEHEINLDSRKAYSKWMYGLLSEIAQAMKVDLPTYKGYVSRVMYFKSGCQKKTYRGKTCRKLPNGSRTKNRDRFRTFRITRESLL